MDSYKEFFKKAEFLLEDVKNNIVNYEPEKSLFLLDEATINFLKSIAEFYSLEIGSAESVEEIIDLIESKTTIKFPPFKDLLVEITYSYCESGCSTSFNYKELPTNYIESIEDLKSFVIDEIGIFNLEE